MATADRTTIKAAIDELITKFRANLVADPMTASKPFRRVVVGDAGTDTFARPFLSITVSRTRSLGAVDDDRVIEVGTTLRIVTDVTAADAHGDALDQIGAVEDYLDAIADTGVLDGAEGPGDRVWSLDYPRSTTGARVVTASATLTLVVKVERSQNRVPAA